MPAARLFIAVIILIAVISVSAGAVSNNVYGVHTFIQDIMSIDYINTHLTWARTLTGPGGYVKQLIYPITPNCSVNPSWTQFVQACYDRQLIPVLRFALWGENGNWVKPPTDPDGSYTTMANTFKNVVAALPKSNDYPLYIEVLNETNNNGEWSGNSNPIEYGKFLVQVSNAIRSLGDSRIKIMNGGLSPGGSYNNLSYIEQMCLNVPGFINSFDVWATHPYTSIPPEQNIHDGTAGGASYTIDHYMQELAVLARYGRTNVKIIATEGGYMGGSDDSRADLMMRAFRDYYSKWSEVLAICPWEFSNPHGMDIGVDWVYADSTGTYPSHRAKIFDWVYNLAKPWMTTGCISGKVTESQFGSPLAGVTVTLNPGGTTATTDSVGDFMFPGLTPGTYSVTASKTNYTTGSKTNIGLSAAENEVANFVLTATSASTIKGTVRDSISGDPLAGVSITANPGGYTATTAADGTYILPGLSPSTYTLTSVKSGFYTYVTEPIVVDAGQTKTVNWWMGPGDVPAGRDLLGQNEFESPLTGGPATAWGSIDGQTHPEIYLVDSTVRYSGISSQRMTPNGSSANQMWRMSNYNATTSGKTYRIEVWCKTLNPAGTVTVKGNFYTNSMGYLSSFTCTPQITTSTGWTRVVGYGTMPACTEGLGRLQVELFATINSGTAWFDNLRMVEDTSGASPVASPMNFSASPNSAAHNITLTFSHGVTSGTTGTSIVYRTDRYPLTVSDGTLITDKAGSAGASDTVYHTNPAWGQRYFYAAFSHKASGANVSRPCFASAMLIDSTAPTAPSPVTDEGVYTFTLDRLSCSWTAASDPETGVVEYNYRIGTTPGGSDIVDWTGVGTSTSVTRTGLALIPGKKYYFSVRAKNGYGTWGNAANSDGIIAVKDCTTIAEAKQQPDTYVVRISGVTTTSASNDLANKFYVSQPDRSSGIQILQNGTPVTVNRGDVLTLIGRLSTVNTERVISLNP